MRKYTSLFILFLLSLILSSAKDSSITPVYADIPSSDGWGDWPGTEDASSTSSCESSSESGDGGTS
jgi:hypothetical protein